MDKEFHAPYYSIKVRWFGGSIAWMLTSLLSLILERKPCALLLSHVQYLFRACHRNKGLEGKVAQPFHLGDATPAPSHAHAGLKMRCFGAAAWILV